jgi:hypothetical protein
MERTMPLPQANIPGQAGTAGRSRAALDCVSDVTRILEAAQNGDPTASSLTVRAANAPYAMVATSSA